MASGGSFLKNDQEQHFDADFPALPEFAISPGEQKGLNQSAFCKALTASSPAAARCKDQAVLGCVEITIIVTLLRE